MVKPDPELTGSGHPTTVMIQRLEQLYQGLLDNKLPVEIFDNSNAGVSPAK